MKTIKNIRQKSVDGPDVEQKAVWGNIKKKKKKSVRSSRGMQSSGLPVIPLFLIHSASMFPEVFVPLDIQLNKVADFDRVDFPSATVADLRQHSVIKQTVLIQMILVYILFILHIVALNYCELH